MKTKQINGKTAGNSLENGRKLSAVENVFHAVKTAARTVFAASALGVLLAGTAFAAAGEDTYQMAEGTESYADVYDMADLFTDEEEKQLSEQAQVLSPPRKIPTPPRCSRTDFTWKAVSEPVPTTRESCFSSIWITGNSTYLQTDR